MNRNLIVLTLISLLSGFSSIASAQDLTGIKCIVMGQREANTKHSVDYLEGKVYLCCPRCKATFSDDNDKFATKANHQLVVTGQYIQTACPSGAKIENPDHKLNIAGVEVNFCSEEEMKQVADETDLDAKVNQVFANASFKKAFSKKNAVDVSKAKCILMPKRAASEKFAVDYQEGKLYFCCKGCVSKFENKKDDAEVIARANEQLFATGHYQQKLCPVGGQELSDDNSIELSGNKIRVCCSKCVEQLTGLDSDDARLEKIFNQDNFAKSFEPKK